MPTIKPAPTSPLALRIAHDIAEQLRSDGEIWEAWMADYIEQEAMSELAEALLECRNALAAAMRVIVKHDGLTDEFLAHSRESGVRDGVGVRAAAALKKAGYRL